MLSTHGSEYKNRWVIKTCIAALCVTSMPDHCYCR